MRREETSAAPKGCECGPCRKKKGMTHNVEARDIHNYTSTPSGGWRTRRTSRDMRMTPTFGIELETAAPEFSYNAEPTPPEFQGLWYRESEPGFARLHDRYRTWQRDRSRREQAAFDRWSQSHLLPEEAVSLAAPADFWHAKHDGSVTGPEFASQPATLDYWRASREAIEGMFRALLHGGMRSHNGATAGMHVNIGSTAFEDGSHLYRFATLIVDNERWAVRLSQRTAGGVEDWARFNPLNDPDYRASWARRWERTNRAGTDRYSVLNAMNEGRIEFRLPRGTLRADRFYAKLEWVAAMVEYTRDALNTLTASSFMAWVAEHGQYPDLHSFMVERIPTAGSGRYTRESQPIVLPDEVRRSDDECDYCGMYRSRSTYGAGCGDFHEDGGRQYCECGDGCALGECASCEEPDDTEYCACGDGCADGDCVTDLCHRIDRVTNINHASATATFEIGRFDYLSGWAWTRDERPIVTNPLTHSSHIAEPVGPAER